MLLALKNETSATYEGQNNKQRELQKDNSSNDQYKKKIQK